MGDALVKVVRAAHLIAAALVEALLVGLGMERDRACTCREGVCLCRLDEAGSQVVAAKGPAHGEAPEDELTVPLAGKEAAGGGGLGAHEGDEVPCSGVGLVELVFIALLVHEHLAADERGLLG